jgi:hypothetical protein
VLETMALQTGSPAMDNVPTSLCPPPPSDERGVTRPQGPACDSGAYEVQVSTPPIGGGGGFSAAPEVTELTVSPDPTTAGASSTYAISFFTSAVGALGAGGTITLVAPAGTSFPSTATSYGVTANNGHTATVGGVTVSNSGTQVVISLGSANIDAGDHVTIAVQGVGNPAPGSYTLTAATRSDPIADTSTAYNITSTTATPGCATVSEQPGWNLTGGSQGTVLTGAAGALFFLPADGSSYSSLPLSTPLSGGLGVWAFYLSPTAVTLPCVGGTSTAVPLSTGQPELLGNPYTTVATLTATGVPTWALTFNAATQTFSSWTRIDGSGSLSLPVGGAAFVATTASGGSTVTITSS